MRTLFVLLDTGMVCFYLVQKGSCKPKRSLPDKVFVKMNENYFRMLNAYSMTEMQDEKTQTWHGVGETAKAEGLMGLAVMQHRANFDLWHEEDKARDPGASDSEIAAVKHAIDRLNQQRND